MQKLAISSLLFALCLSGCISNTEYTPKRTGYFRIALPERKYIQYVSQCPFTFEYPVYAIVKPDTGPGTGPYWLNITFPGFRCNVYMSYLTVDTNLNSYIEECRKFVVEHEVKASAINEQQVMNR